MSSEMYKGYVTLKLRCVKHHTHVVSDALNMWTENYEALANTAYITEFSTFYQLILIGPILYDIMQSPTLDYG